MRVSLSGLGAASGQCQQLPRLRRRVSHSSDVWKMKGCTIVDSRNITDDVAEVDVFVDKRKALSEVETTEKLEVETDTFEKPGCATEGWVTVRRRSKQRRQHEEHAEPPEAEAAAGRYRSSSK